VKSLADTADGLREWADDRTSSLANFARSIAEALVDPKASPSWAHIDLRAEAEARRLEGSGEPESELLRVVRIVVVPLYVVPILLTWWHLRSAVGAFAEFGATQRPDANLNFLSFWAGGYGGAIDTTTLQSTGFQVVFVVALILVGQAITSWKDEMQTPVEVIPADLVLDSQLHFAARKVLTPQDLAESIAEAAGLLENAITSITDQVRNAEALVTMIADTTKKMAEAADKLATASDKLDHTLEPLDRIREALDITDSTIRTSTGALADVGRNISDLSQDLVVVTNAAGEVAEGLHRVVPGTERLLSVIVEAARTVDGIIERIGGSIGSTGEEFSRELLASAQALSSALDGAGRTLTDLLRQGGQVFSDATRQGATNIRESANGVADDLGRIVSGANDVAQRLERMSSAIADHAPIAETLGNFIGDLDQVVKNILNAVSEIKVAAETYRAVNEGLRQEGSGGAVPGRQG